MPELVQALVHELLEPGLDPGVEEVRMSRVDTARGECEVVCARDGVTVDEIDHGYGDRMVGRFDPRFERDTGILRINAVHAEAGERDGDAQAVRRAIDELARWLRAVDVTYAGAMPRTWRRTLAT